MSDPDASQPYPPGYVESMRQVAERMTSAETRLARIAILCDEVLAEDPNAVLRATDVQALVGDPSPGLLLTREEATLAVRALRNLQSESSSMPDLLTFEEKLDVLRLEYKIDPGGD